MFTIALAVEVERPKATLPPRDEDWLTGCIHITLETVPKPVE